MNPHLPSNMIRLILMLALVYTTSSNLMSNHRRLMHYILEDNQGQYDKTARPVLDLDTYMNIDLSFHLRSIKEVDFQSGEMETVGWLGLTWLNEYAIWDPKEFGGIDEIMVPNDMFWKPDIYLFNDASGQYNARIYSNNIQFLMRSDGTTHWFTPTTFRSLCDLANSDPNEISCPLVFGSWMHHEGLISLNTTTSNADLSNFSGNKVWELMEAKSTWHSKIYDCCIEPFVDITWDIKMVRRVPHPEEHHDDSEEEN